MLPELLTNSSTCVDVHIRDPQVVFAPGESGGTLTVHPAFADLFARLGLSSASTFLQLPGVVVSGHPDRHVMRIELPGASNAFYLKGQHVVGWREKRRNRLAGFGRVSRCEREANLLQQFEAEQLPAPRWAAFGTHGHQAFLLVEEVPDCVELRRILGNNSLPLRDRRTLATNIGRALAAFHTAGVTTPDITAKHVFVNVKTLAVTLLDWQSATRIERVDDAMRADALGALHASLVESLASPSERLRVLAAYRKTSAPRDSALPRQDFSHASTITHRRNASSTTPILHAANRHRDRRSIRDQLQLPAANTQQLVWLAGEAVCAVPEIAAAWPRPAVAPPFYGLGPDGVSQVRFANCDATLVRGWTAAPLGRIRAWLHASPWRSPGVTIGRVLFHLERYAVPAPRLFAFGQQLTSATRAEWFALYEWRGGVPLRNWRRTASFGQRRAIRDSLVKCVQKLHDAGCVLSDPKAAFAVGNGSVFVADPQAVRIVRRVSAATRQRDLRQVLRLLGME